MIKNIVSFTGLFLLTVTGIAQTTDLARIEYMTVPFANSDNSVSRFRALAQLPLPLTKDSDEYLILGLEYRYTDININDAVPFDTATLDAVQRIEAYLGYTNKVGKNWRFGVKAGVRINSNLEHSLISDDFIYGAAVYFINDMKDDSLRKPYRIILGLAYSTTPGRNFPLPLINYYREFHPDWTFTLGVPKTNVRHYLNPSHKDALQAFATLDNFFGNIQDNIVVGDKVAENISMTTVVTGLGYEHYFTDHVLYYAYAAYSVLNDFRLRDNERNDIYTLNDENTFYFRTGIKLKI